MKIKICGLRDPENIAAVVALNPDYVGFICYERSPRFIGDSDTAISQNIPGSILKTGVFVDESQEKIEQLIADHGFNVIQLHGSESPELADSFRDKVTVLKAFGLDNDFDFTRLDAYANKVDYFLFDTKTAIHGGSGKTFNWDILNKYTLNVPFFLSGGLSLDNLEQVAKIAHPQFYGVDLNSRFETAPGIKDIEKLKKAFGLIKQLNTHEIRS
jgi:phosphoribosylanthranilate isomerase